MSDEKVRDAERRWLATRSVEDAAAYLRERVRAGELHERRLSWAAACGSPGARRAIDDAPVPEDLPALHAELVEDAPAVEARFWVAVILAAWSVLGDHRHLDTVWLWERQLLGLPGRSIFHTMEATHASDLLLAPCDLTRRAFARLHGEPPPTWFPAHLRRDPGPALEELSAHVPPAIVRRVLLRDWVPWLLGIADPVAERAAANPEPPVGDGVGYR